MATQKKKTLSNSRIVENFTKRIQGLRGMQGKLAIPIKGKSYSPAQVQALYQACLDAATTLAVLEGQVKEGLVARDGALATCLDLEQGLKAWVNGQFGETSQTASTMGYKPRKTVVRTAKDKQQAVEQGLATRKARNTLGPKAKLQIKGTVVVPSVPVATPAPLLPPVLAGSTPTPTNGVHTP